MNCNRIRIMLLALGFLLTGVSLKAAFAPEFGHYGNPYQFFNQYALTRVPAIPIRQDFLDGLSPYARNAIRAFLGGDQQLNGQLNDFFIQIISPHEAITGRAIPQPWNVCWHRWALGHRRDGNVQVEMGLLGERGVALAAGQGIALGELTPAAVHIHGDHLSPNNAHWQAQAGRSVISFFPAARYNGRSAFGMTLVLNNQPLQQLFTTLPNAQRMGDFQIYCAFMVLIAEGREVSVAQVRAAERNSAEGIIVAAGYGDEDTIDLINSAIRATREVSDRRTMNTFVEDLLQCIQGLDFNEQITLRNVLLLSRAQEIRRQLFEEGVGGGLPVAAQRPAAAAQPQRPIISAPAAQRPQPVASQRPTVVSQPAAPERPTVVSQPAAQRPQPAAPQRPAVARRTNPVAARIQRLQAERRAAEQAQPQRPIIPAPAAQRPQPVASQRPATAQVPAAQPQRPLSQPIVPVTPTVAPQAAALQTPANVEPDQCPFCWESVQDFPDDVIYLRCGHGMHRGGPVNQNDGASCLGLRRWLSQNRHTCPLCRSTGDFINSGEFITLQDVQALVRLYDRSPALFDRVEMMAAAERDLQALVRLYNRLDDRSPALFDRVGMTAAEGPQIPTAINEARSNSFRRLAELFFYLPQSEREAILTQARLVDAAAQVPAAQPQRPLSQPIVPVTPTIAPAVAPQAAALQTPANVEPDQCPFCSTPVEEFPEHFIYLSCGHGMHSERTVDHTERDALVCEGLAGLERASSGSWWNAVTYTCPLCRANIVRGEFITLQDLQALIRLYDRSHALFDRVGMTAAGRAQIPTAINEARSNSFLRLAKLFFTLPLSQREAILTQARSAHPDIAHPDINVLATLGADSDSTDSDSTDFNTTEHRMRELEEELMLEGPVPQRPVVQAAPVRPQQVRPAAQRPMPAAVAQPQRPIIPAPAAPQRPAAQRPQPAAPQRPAVARRTNPVAARIQRLQAERRAAEQARQGQE